MSDKDEGWLPLTLICTFILTCWGCVSWCQLRGAPSAAPRSLARRPWWCSAGDAHAGTGTGPGSAWLPVHSGAAPSGEVASLPGKNKKINGEV